MTVMLYHVCHKKHKIYRQILAHVIGIMNNNKSFKSRRIDFYKLFGTWSINTCGLIHAFLFNTMTFILLKACIFLIFNIVLFFCWFILNSSTSVILRLLYRPVLLFLPFLILTTLDCGSKDALLFSRIIKAQWNTI